MKLMKIKLVTAGPAECAWRRLQVHEQQAERERKNVLQKVLVFKSRANQLLVEEWRRRGLHQIFLFTFQENQPSSEQALILVPHPRRTRT